MARIIVSTSLRWIYTIIHIYIYGHPFDTWIEMHTSENFAVNTLSGEKVISIGLYLFRRGFIKYVNIALELKPMNSIM